MPVTGGGVATLPPGIVASGPAGPSAGGTDSQPAASAVPLSAAARTIAQPKAVAAC